MAAAAFSAVLTAVALRVAVTSSIVVSMVAVTSSTVALMIAADLGAIGGVCSWACHTHKRMETSTKVMTR